MKGMSTGNSRNLRICLLLTTGIGLSGAMGGSAQARDFSIRQTLFQALEAKSSQQPDRMVELLVRVKTPHSDSEPFSEGPLEESLEARRLSVEDSSRDLVSRLEPIPLAAASQVSTDLIPGLAKSPIVLDTYWAARCIHLLVPASQVSSLMNHPHVDGIFEDTQVQAIPEDELTPQTTDALITATTDWWGQHKIRSSEARQRFKVDGQGVLVGHIDTGIDPSHPALNGKIHRFMDFVNKRPSAYDDQGHGTHTAGSIAGGGGMGVAPGVRLVVAKALNSRGDGRLSNLLKAMQWMLDPDGNPQTADYPAVVNNSWGVKPTAAKRQGFESTLFWESVRAWRSKGIVPVFAAGNKGPGNLLVPGAYPVNLGVGATDRNDHVVSFSASGRIDWIGRGVFQAGPLCPRIRHRLSQPRGQSGHTVRNIDGSSACHRAPGSFDPAQTADSGERP